MRAQKNICSRIAEELAIYQEQTGIAPDVIYLGEEEHKKFIETTLPGVSRGVAARTPFGRMYYGCNVACVPGEKQYLRVGTKEARYGRYDRLKTLKEGREDERPGQRLESPLR